MTQRELHRSVRYSVASGSACSLAWAGISVEDDTLDLLCDRARIPVSGAKGRKGSDQRDSAPAVATSDKVQRHFRERRATELPAEPSAPSPALLGDTPERDYARKLRSFNRFAEPELRAAIDSLALQPGMSVLDAGCGTGEALHWLARAVAPGGKVTGVDLSAPHVTIARATAPAGVQVLEGDLGQLSLPSASFDLVWCVNTINHFREPLEALGSLKKLLRPGGRIALGQTSLLPDMCFAWDSRLERLVNEAVRSYYRDRYALCERDLGAVRAIAGVLRSAGIGNVMARTFVIERLSPLGPADRDYLLDTIFRNTWGERLRPYLSGADYAELERLCDPAGSHFALERPDFHFIQTFTLATGTR